jgi:hypothetical protein
MPNRTELIGNPARPLTVVADPDTVDNPILEFFLAYWREKRGTARLPLRAAFNSKEVGTKLPWVTVVDALPDYSDFRYRVIGTHIDEYFILNATGMTVTEAFAKLNVRMGRLVISILQKTCIDRTPVRLTGPDFVLNNKFFPDYDTLYLPFSSDGEHTDRVVNAFVFNARKIMGARVPEMTLLTQR